MQFYLNGYTPGDPAIHAASSSAGARMETLPDVVDVLIVGSGPAGMLLAAQLLGRRRFRAGNHLLHSGWHRGVWRHLDNPHTTVPA
jgi:hypothetical protein